MNSPVHGVAHYENFPVASWLMPRRLRPAVIAIYHFARHADDLADEGDAPAAQRLQALATLHQSLDQASRGEVVESEHVQALGPHMRQWHLDWGCLHALLSAFEQDVTVHRYANEAALTDYCRRSANPVGHLMLQLFGQASPMNLALSDCICTALQRLNFLQDAALDWQRGRLYLPQDALAAQSVEEADLDRAARQGVASPALRACIQDQAQDVRALLEQGAALPRQVGGRLRWELRAVLAGAYGVLNQLHAGGYDPFRARPRLGWRHAPSLCATTIGLALTRPRPLSPKAALP